MIVKRHGAVVPILSTHPVELPNFTELVTDFLGELAGRVDQMQTALQNADCETLKEHAHWLNSAGSSAGFGCLTEPSHQLEQASVDRQLPTTKTLLPEIEELSHRLEGPLACEQLSKS
jgi:HPt (histidine-containing phosphotransfer) domain-containing protein